MKHRFRLNRVYHVKFLDHIKNQSTPLVCNVWGLIIEDEPEHIAVAWWSVEHDDEGTVESNREVLSIVKSTIVSKKLLD